MIKNKKKAVALLSGGLDSTIATKLIKDMGIDIVALNFHTVFCTCNRDGCKFESKKVSKQFNIPLKVMSVTKDYMKVIRNPKFGYGSAMNPCIDCRIFMFKKAKDYMNEIEASFIITGEVLGQRPMSQGKSKMALIEKEAGLNGLILRPLTSFNDKLYDNIKSSINFNDLPNITGRSRKKQIDLAEKHKIDNYLCASGGCLLTDKDFTIRLKDYFEHNDEDDINQIKLLRIGRHFRLNKKIKLVVPRDEKEVNKLNFYKHVGIYLTPNIKGPTGLVLGEDINIDNIKLAARIISRYCYKPEVYFEPDKLFKPFTVKAFKPEDLTPYWIKR